MNIKNFLKKGLIACFMFSVLMAGFSYSQESTGKIVGTVTDEEGLTLPGVAVEVSSPSLMGIRADVTTDKGLYRFINLNPGRYKAVFRLEGFNVVETPEILVSVGGTTTVDARLGMAILAEEVIVIGEAPMIDVEKSGLTSTFRAEDIEMIPIPRTRFGISSMLEMNPGFSDYNAFGSDGNMNNFNLDGLQASSPEAGSLRMTPDVEVVQEVEMITIGAPAEYGQMTGAVVNIVKKYGGNKLEGSVGLYLKPDYLISDNNPDTDKWHSLEHQRWYDFSAFISGALAKDTIWFFAYANSYDEKTVSWAGNPDYPMERMKVSFELKVTAQIGTRHKISGNLMHIYYEYPKPPTVFKTPQAADIGYFSKPGYFFNWDWQLSRSALFSMKAGIWMNPERGGEVWPGVGASLYVAPHYDEETGIQSIAPYRFNWWNNAKFAFNNYISNYAEDFLGGDHDFKVGVQFSRGVSHQARGWPGNAYYTDRNNQPFEMEHRYPHHYGGYVTAMGAFVDDSMKVGDRLTLNLGVRFDHIDCDIPEWPLMDGPEDIPGTAAPGAENIIIHNHFSPRLGFTYQLTADRKTILKAHWGLYYYGGISEQFSIPGPGKRDTTRYEYIGPPTTTFPYATNPFDDPDNWRWLDTILGGDAFSMDPNIKNTVSSQFTVGIDREVLSNLSVGIAYVYKKEWDQVGLIDKGVRYEETQMVSPDNDQTYTVFNAVEVGEHDIWQVNPEEYEFDYHSVIFTLNKRYSNNWMLNCSLQWQKATGLNNGFPWGGGSQSMWENDFGIDANDFINAKGIMPFALEWIFKAQMAYTFPYGFSIGATYNYQSGEFYGVYVEIPDLTQGSREILDQELGASDRRHPAQHRMSLRVEKIFNIKPVKLHLIADVHNVFNNTIITRYRSYWLGSSSFLATRGINNPRIIQIGFKIAF